MNKKISIYFLVNLILMLCMSCANVKKAKKDRIYLNEGNLDTVTNYVVPVMQTQIQKGDLLGITVYSDNLDATARYNKMSTASTAMSPAAGSIQPSAGDGGSGSGYLVDQEGNIRIQDLGKIKVEGLSRLQLSDTIVARLQPYLKNPYVEISFLNLRVSVMGEVRNPGVISLRDEKISILQAISMVGDITTYGRKDNVLIIREQNGKREFGRIDLRKANAFQSPYFYLQQNDMVLVEASARKPSDADEENTRKRLAIISLATLVSTLAVLVTIFK